MQPGSWRWHCAPIIARVLAANEGKTEKEIRRAIRDAYPYGQRKYWPYKIWCDEVARQRGRQVGRMTKRAGKQWKPPAEKLEAAGQLRLFHDPQRTPL